MSDDSIELHYQPASDGRGRVLGFEALLRWHHRQRGLISPEAFMPIFEDSDLMVPLSWWALRTSCLQAASWRRPLRVAINLSRSQLLDPRLPDLVQAALAESDLDPDRLEFEVTEATLASVSGEAGPALARLVEHGVRITLDDAGGNGALPLIVRDYPFSGIKIARNVVSRIEISATARSVIEMMLLFGRSVSFAVTAKGVETCEQMSFLKEHGCTLFQGFLLGQPAPIERFGAVTGNQADTPTADGSPTGNHAYPSVQDGRASNQRAAAG